MIMFVPQSKEITEIGGGAPFDREIIPFIHPGNNEGSWPLHLAISLGTDLLVFLPLRSAARVEIRILPR